MDDSNQIPPCDGSGISALGIVGHQQSMVSGDTDQVN